MTFKRWSTLLILYLIIGFLLRLTYLVAFSISLLVILSLANWWQKRALDDVHYSRRFHYRRAFPGEKHPVQIEVVNNKLLPLSWLRIQDPWPRAVSPEDESILSSSHIQDMGFLDHVFSLRWYERVRKEYSLLFRKRGVYQVGPAQLYSGDLFGIFQNRQTGSPENRLTVFPEPAPVEAIEHPAHNPFGEATTRRRLLEDPNRPMGVREYHPEDGFRRVHWPATARTGQLQVKIFQPTSAQVVVLCLNVSTMERYWEGVYPDLLEHLLSTAATYLMQAVDYGYRVGLVANGCLVNSDQPFRIPPGRSPDHPAYLLEALAGISPVVVAPFERFLLREIPRLTYGARLLVLTAVVTPGLVETLLRVRRHERSITLISLEVEPPPIIPGLKVIHNPFDLFDRSEPQPVFSDTIPEYTQGGKAAGVPEQVWNT